MRYLIMIAVTLVLWHYLDKLSPGRFDGLVGVCGLLVVLFFSQWCVDPGNRTGRQIDRQIGRVDVGGYRDNGGGGWFSGGSDSGDFGGGDCGGGDGGD